MKPYIELKGLTKVFSTPSWRKNSSKQQFIAVNDINLTIHRGEIVGLIGESGSGKSTLGRMICRLLEPTAGEVLINGQSITSLPNKQMRSYYRQMQMIFQDHSSALNPRKKIGEQIIKPMMRLGVVSSRKEAEAATIVLLERVGLKAEHMHRYPHEFSGGQRQRIGIARALAVQAEFIILDEPTSALDVSIQAQILNLLLDLRDEFDLTYLFIGHNLAVIEFFCDTVAVMEQGEIVEYIVADQLFSHAIHSTTKKLIESVPSIEKFRIRQSQLVDGKELITV
ncbi:ATP-binding cassette domain-containing protein [Paenibacillus endoradicis]|uniref:ATP-binding cassette domain-containing protein n=1 Tax=Paenibacillus endoradicis TaxID=2972487 RepID=UPI00215915B6|nr:ATP-binding cassette domain-containing protein [Paenibacillus endoradicis]MCR8655964.1 ATP-binding cassette domain-containing protein [Paenibacillus endoradicis]MCR8658290.1 ATP-binding cassette domain-containing protein [Paenibacillus endoradicis]